ncbi:MAG: carboxymuconolactone decarboxylase family protein, partial [Pseudomonadota bacterium]
MSKNWPEILKGVAQSTGGLAKDAPDAMRAFGGLAAAATKDGALDKKTKELMCAAISICLRCDGCIAYHTNAAIKAGASR